MRLPASAVRASRRRWAGRYSASKPSLACFLARLVHLGLPGLDLAQGDAQSKPTPSSCSCWRIAASWARWTSAQRSVNRGRPIECYTAPMTVAELRHQAKGRLDAPTPERLKVADDFLAYLEEREADEATAELLAVPGLLESLSSAEEEIAAGELTPVEDLRRKALRWTFREGWPSKWEGPALDAKNNETAIETLEITSEGIELE